MAASAALALTAWGTAALPAAAAEQGKGNGTGHSHAKHQGKGHKNGSAHKGNNGSSASKGNNGSSASKGNNGSSASKGNNGSSAGNGNSSPGNSGSAGSSAGKGNSGQGGANAGAKGGDPAGNNGTVKITPIGEDDGTPQNTPHVTCGFDIEWYGFDEGPEIISKVTLAMHAPTDDVQLTPGGPSEVFVGGDPATGAGTETGFDGEATYYPTFVGEPHPQQGYHIKLTINTPGSQGADTKHKVFWVEPCGPEVGGEDDTDTDTDTDTEVEGEQETDTDTDTDVEVEGEQDSSTSTEGSDTEVAGAQAQAGAEAGSDVPSAVDAGEGDSMVDTLTSPVPLALILLGMALAGLGFLTRRRTS